MTPPEGFRVVVGTNPAEGFLCDCLKPIEVEADSDGLEATLLVGTIGEDGTFRLFMLLEEASGAFLITDVKLGIPDSLGFGDVKRGIMDTGGACAEYQKG